MLPGALLALASGLAAQQASYTYILEPRGGSTALTALNLPRLDTTLRLHVPTGWSDHLGSFWGEERVWLLTGSGNPALDLRALRIASVLYTTTEIVTSLPTAYPSPFLLVIDYPISKRCPPAGRDILPAAPVPRV